MTCFYSDIDPCACATLREMMAAGMIGDGVIDERDVATIQPRELAGYDRVHLFAGIGGFEIAARLAGWPDGMQLWTGGFPCQPFSVAGRRDGAADDRYLWPEFARLLDGCRPEFVVIENVPALDDATDMVLDRVCLDLESFGYEVAPPFEIPACAIDAAHERNRVWIVANCPSERRDEVSDIWYSYGQQKAGERSAEPVAHRHVAGSQERSGIASNAQQERSAVERGCASDFGWVACHDIDTLGRRRHRRLPLGLLDPAVVLAHGLPSRTAALHGLGNSIVPQIAAEIMRAMLQ